MGDKDYKPISIEESKDIVEQELRNFEKGFGIKIGIYNVNTIKQESLRFIIEQYYTAALLMVPNTSQAKYPYNKDVAGPTYPKAQENVLTRLKRVKLEIDRLIELYAKLENAPDEATKKTFMTYIKLYETDAINNIVHAYDVDLSEKGSRSGTQTKSFEENFCSTRQYTHKIIDYKDVDNPKLAPIENPDIKARCSALNKFIRYSFDEMANVIGPQTLNGKSLKINDFFKMVNLGFRASLLRVKDKGILDLALGDYDVVPCILVSSSGKCSCSEIVFVGKGNVSTCVTWHLGSSGELVNNRLLDGVGKFRHDDIALLNDRKLPNSDALERSYNKGNTLDPVREGEISILDKCLEFKFYRKKALLGELINLYKKHKIPKDEKKGQFLHTVGLRKLDALIKQEMGEKDI